jgi:hypothetical protein
MEKARTKQAGRIRGKISRSVDILRNITYNTHRAAFQFRIRHSETIKKCHSPFRSGEGWVWERDFKAFHPDADPLFRVRGNRRTHAVKRLHSPLCQASPVFHTLRKNRT